MAEGITASRNLWEEFENRECSLCSFNFSLIGGKKISVLFHASLGALCQARRLWGHHRRSIRGLSAICPHRSLVTAFHLRGKTMQPVGESQPLASWRISAWMGSFKRGFFVMLNPGDLLTGFGPFTSFHKCCKGQRISKLLTQWGKGWPGLHPAVTSAL